MQTLGGLAGGGLYKDSLTWDIGGRQSAGHSDCAGVRPQYGSRGRIDSLMLLRLEYESGNWIAPRGPW